MLLRTGRLTYCTGTVVVLATASWMDNFRPRMAASERLARSIPLRAMAASTVRLWAMVGAAVGMTDGRPLKTGANVGNRVVGIAVGITEGNAVGTALGTAEGNTLGVTVGFRVVGLRVGRAAGLVEGTGESRPRSMPVLA